MSVSKESLLAILPPYKDEWVTVKGSQDVRDIITDMLRCHEEFAEYYDAIAGYFWTNDLRATCEGLYNFCLQNIQYCEETEALQTTALPTGILTRGHGDCKHYASFIGGVLGALQRKGISIDWYYCFASYSLTDPDPYHVFVVCNIDGTPLYIDPTPGANEKTPVWVINEYANDFATKRVKGLAGIAGMVIDGGGRLAGKMAVNGITDYGTLYPAPAWYPTYLPLFYNNNGALNLRPSNAVPAFTENDVLDCMLYLQTIVGYNRADYASAVDVAAIDSTKKILARQGITDNFKNNPNGNGNGDFFSGFHNAVGVDGAQYSSLQQRYIANQTSVSPWLANMQAVGGGIDLMTIAMPTDTEIPRPSFYPDYLPSLCISAGLVGQYPVGHMDTKPKIRTGKSSGFADYAITPVDVASLMLYAQPVISQGPTPYPTNWYINDNVNGAMAFRYKITLGFSDAFTNAQEQAYGMSGDMMKAPVLDANPFASGFSETMQTIIGAAVNFFAGKIPGGTAAVKAADYATTLSGGQVITGGPVPPGVFSAQVFQAADALATQLDEQATTNTYILIAVAAAAVLLGWYYWPDIKKYL